MSKKTNTPKENNFYFGGNNLTKDFGPTALLEEQDMLNEDIPEEVEKEIDSQNIEAANK